MTASTVTLLAAAEQQLPEDVGKAPPIGLLLIVVLLALMLIPGTPTLEINGGPTLAGVRDAGGAASPSDHRVTLNGTPALRYLVDNGHLDRESFSVNEPMRMVVSVTISCNHRKYHGAFAGLGA